MPVTAGSYKFQAMDGTRWSSSCNKFRNAERSCDGDDASLTCSLASGSCSKHDGAM